MSTVMELENNKSHREDGFLLLGVLFLMLLLLLAMSIAAPKIAESIRRDKEVETVHRGMQYAHAIQVFYAKTGRYPTSIDQLMKTNNQRFLRKRYLDPMTGKDDWRLIHQGEAKVPPLGLFGQAAQTGGITPTGANTGGGSGFGSPTTGAGGSSSLGSSGTGFGGSGSSFGSSGAGGSTGTGFGGTGSSFGASGSGGSTGSAFGSTGSATGGTDGTTTGTSGFGSTTIGGPTTTGSSGSAFGSPGASFGGAPIVGVGLLSKNTSIKIYKKQTHYNQWEFVFDPNQNTLQGTAGASTNLNGASNSTGVNGSTGTGFGSGSGASGGTGFGSGNGSGFGSTGGSGFGSNNGVGGSPAAPVNPNSPGTSQ